jgi:hypothetical protein
MSIQHPPSSVYDDAQSNVSWPVANDWLIAETELNFGSCHGLDQAGPLQVGVGLFFIPNPEDNGAFYVSSIVPGSSANISGIVDLFDKLMTLDNKLVVGLSLSELRRRLFGRPGTLVQLEFIRPTEGRVFQVVLRLFELGLI